MRKGLLAVSLSGLLLSCGGGGPGGGTPGTGGGQSSTGLQITSVSINPQNGSVSVGQNLSMSASWSVDRSLVQTRVKLCLSRKTFYFCDLMVWNFYCDVPLRDPDTTG